MEISIFDALAVIEFESQNIDYYELMYRLNSEDRDKLNRVYSKSSLYKIWKLIWKISPNYYFLDFILTKVIGEHIDIGNLTIFGYNAMMYLFRLKTDKGFWVFRPPCIFIMGERGFTWGQLYFSPDGTSHNPKAKIYYKSRNV